MKFKIEHGILLAFCCLILPAVNSGLVTDFTGFVEGMMLRPEASIFKKYGYHSLHGLTSVAMYLPYKIWGLCRMCWGLYFLFLHLAAGIALFEAFNLFLIKLGISESRLASLLAALIFLIQPYQLEAVVWEACLSYLLTSLLMAGSFYFLLKAERINSKTFILSAGLYFLSLFTIELPFTFPLIIGLALLVVYGFKNWKTILTQSSVYFGLLGMYLILNRIVEGKWIGHYGAEVHLNVSPFDMAATINKYLLKNTLFIRHWPHNSKMSWFDGLNDVWIAVATFGIVAIICLWPKNMAWRKASLFSFGAFLFASLPTSNLFFSYILFGENDRYGYWGMAFFGLLLVSLAFGLNKRVGLVLTSIYIVICSYFTLSLSLDWARSEKVRYNLVQNFPKDLDKPVIALNNPDNYKGLYMFRTIGEGSGLYDALHYIGGRKDVPQIHEVYQYNMTSVSDGCDAWFLGQDSIRNEFKQWGNWYWTDGIGASNKNNDLYSTKIDGHVYYLKLKQPADSFYIICQKGNEWKLLPSNHNHE